MNRLVFIVAMLIFLLTGCLASPDTRQSLPESTSISTKTSIAALLSPTVEPQFHQTTQTYAALATIKAENQVTREYKLSQTPKLSPTSTPTRTRTPTLTPTIDLQVSEAQISMVTSLNNIPEGVLVISEDSSLYTPLYLHDLKSNRQTTLGDVYIPYAISPDFNKLAYIRPLAKVVNMP